MNFRYPRIMKESILSVLKSGKSVLMLGPRQVGKTTLAEDIVKAHPYNQIFYLQDQQTLFEIQSDPAFLKRSIEAQLSQVGASYLLVLIDEIQLYPELTNSLQYLLDKHKRKLRLILSGSSARKLKRSHANLLPGRLVSLGLGPLTFVELSRDGSFSDKELESYLRWGGLPEICSEKELKLREMLLRSYVSTYVKEEIQTEGAIRKLPPFARFLKLSALKSGQQWNFTEISRDVGVPARTVQNYVELLLDTLLVFELPAFTQSSTGRSQKSSRYYWFDGGVANAACGESPDRIRMQTEKGALFENAFINNCVLLNSYGHKDHQLSYWRNYEGAEIDLLVDTGKRLIGVEVKSSDTVRPGMARHIENFRTRKGARIDKGYVVYLGAREQKLSDTTVAVNYLQFIREQFI